MGQDNKKKNSTPPQIYSVAFKKFIVSEVEQGEDE